MNLSDLLRDAKERASLVETEGGAYLKIPFFHRYESESVTLKFYEIDDCLYLSDDCSTVAHLQNRYLDIEEYREIVEKIKKRFYLTEQEGHEFVLAFPSDSYPSIEMFVGFFLQAISMLGNLDLLT